MITLFAHLGVDDELLHETVGFSVSDVAIACIVAAFVGFCVVLFIKQR